jgi:SWI/SNF-related matrix-associated actin-dependent regulator of chromatin subfamily A containing DEAD/H box 1
LLLHALQNSPQELLTLLSFLMPTLFAKGMLDSDDDAGGGDDAAAAAMLRHFVSVEGQKGVSDAAAYGRLKQLLAPFVLRRRKVDVLHQILPAKTREVEYVELEPSARIVYDSILEEHLKNKKAGIRTSQTTTGHLFTQLRKASHHPLLLRTRYKTPVEKEHLARCFHKYGAFRGEGCTRERVAQELESMSDFIIHLTALELLQDNPIGRADDLERYTLSEEDLFASAKFQRLRTLLPDLVQKGHRILLFSVWTSCLDLLSCLMDSLGLAYRRMEGSTPVPERQALMDEFNGNDEIPVFLLSTKACGLGINLTSADVCIMHDLDFNPFNDLQAEEYVGVQREMLIVRWTMCVACSPVHFCSFLCANTAGATGSARSGP